MSDQIYEIDYAINRDGGTQTVEIKDIPYDVYKAAKSSFVDHPEKAIRLIISSCGLVGKEEALNELEKQNLVAINSLESGLAELIVPIKATIKKKSKKDA